MGVGRRSDLVFLDGFEAADLVLDTAIRDSLSSPAEVEVELAI